MISTEVQRTLVKSPPELWAELSDQEALARHLGELGEIRITKIEPEQTVEWEAEAAKGKVQLKPSGWGTKVTLSVTQALPERSRRSGELDGAHECSDEPTVDVPDAAVDVPDAAVDVPESSEHVEHATAEEPAPELAPEAEQAPRPRFLARLFRRKARRTRVATTTDAVADADAGAHPAPAEPVPANPAQTAAAAVAIEPERTDSSETGGDAQQDTQQADLDAEIAATEEALEAQTTELLSTLLDRLGTAHHRPFSRA
jgi:hypothetical protein